MRVASSSLWWPAISAGSSFSSSCHASRLLFGRGTVYAASQAPLDDPDDHEVDDWIATYADEREPSRVLPMRALLVAS
jgi:hypothetical protein